MCSALAPRRQIVLDMTPLDAGGQNGGAGVVAVSLVRQMGALAPEWDFTLLTARASHAELSSLDAPNVRRSCVVDRTRSLGQARKLADRLLPPGVSRRLRRAYWSVRTGRTYRRAAGEGRTDLLFCPFTVPYFWRSGVACVCLVHDLQHLTYPAFFTPEQRLNRQQHLVDAARRANRLVCVSEYVRDTVLANLEVSAERVVTIPHGLLSAPGAPDASVLDRLGLVADEFLLYPANFWPHKNHRALFEALGVLRSRQPASSLKLVCTGAPNALLPGLRAAAARLLPGGTVLFPGYVSEAELEALLGASAALVFPSLYEGFGMPLLEAMALGKPVLCSNLTSLPEVAGEAATYFDPTRPEDIARAIETLQTDPELVGHRVELGRRRAASFGDARDMAARYLALFRQVLKTVPAVC